MTPLKGLDSKKLGPFFEMDLEIQFLENLFENECKCESKHINTTSAICSVQATHRAYVTCLKSPGVNICAELALADFIWMNNDELCGDCKRLASECWTIRPI